MFDASELQMLISGGENRCEYPQDWKENVEYGGYFDDDTTVVYFWEVISEMTPEEIQVNQICDICVQELLCLGFGLIDQTLNLGSEMQVEVLIDYLLLQHVLIY